MKILQCNKVESTIFYKLINLSMKFICLVAAEVAEENLKEAPEVRERRTVLKKKLEKEKKEAEEGVVDAEGVDPEGIAQDTFFVVVLVVATTRKEGKPSLAKMAETRRTRRVAEVVAEDAADSGEDLVAVVALAVDSVEAIEEVLAGSVDLPAEMDPEVDAGDSAAVDVDAVPALAETKAERAVPEVNPAPRFNGPWPIRMTVKLRSKIYLLHRSSLTGIGSRYSTSPDFT